MDGPMDELMGGLKDSLTESHGTTSRRLTYPMKIGCITFGAAAQKERKKERKRERGIKNRKRVK